MTKADFFKINWKDAAKGLIIAVITGVLTTVVEFFKQHKQLPVGSEWDIVWQSALIAGVSYLVKNVFSNSQGKFMKTEKNNYIWKSLIPKK